MKYANSTEIIRRWPLPKCRNGKMRHGKKRKTRPTMNEYAMDRLQALPVLQGEGNHREGVSGSMAGKEPTKAAKIAKPCRLAVNAPVHLCIESIKYKTKCQPNFTGSKGREFPQTIVHKSTVPAGYVTVNAAYFATHRRHDTIKAWAMKGMVRTVKSIGHMYVCLEDVIDQSGGKHEEG